MFNVSHNVTCGQNDLLLFGLFPKVVEMKTNRRKNSQFVHIGDVVEKVLSNCRYERDDLLSKIWDIWTTAVGTEIAENAKPAAIRGGCISFGFSRMTC